jgi:beta-lactamase regulating signal transducer with metallopeptidase domain
MIVWLTSIGYMLADFFVGGTLLLGAVLIVLGRIKQPSKRLAVARTALMALALLAVLFAVPDWPRFSIFRPESGSVNAATDKESQNIASLAPSRERLNIQSDAAHVEAPETRRSSKTDKTELPQTRPSDSAWAESLAPEAQGIWHGLSMSWPALLAAMEGLTVVLVGAWLIVGAVQSRRLCHRAFPAPTFVYQTLQQMALRHERLPCVLLSPDAPNPVTLGVRHPTILLPADFAASYDPQSLRSALAHELAHVRHGDLRLLLLGRGLLLLLAVHPFFRRLWRIIRDDQETLADAAACAENRPQYAAELVKWARQAVGHPNTGLAAALGIWESHSQLSRRIVMLLDENYHVDIRCSRKWRYQSLAAMAGLSLALSLATIQPMPSARAAASDDKPQPAANAEKQKDQKQPAESLTYTGQVVEKATGIPITGAGVTVLRRVSSRASPFPEWKKLGETKHQTGADGRYTFTVPPEQVAEDLLYIEITATHPEYVRYYGGYSFNMIRKNEKLGERPFFEKLSLMPAESVTGTIVLPDGTPSQGVAVKIFSSPTKDAINSSTWDEATTDDKGVFKLKAIKGGAAVFWIIPKDYSPSTHVLHNKRGDLGRFILEKGLVLKGRVMDAEGKPLKDVWVNADIRGGPAKQKIDMSVFDYLARSALSDDKGEFAMAPLPAGDYDLIVADQPRAGSGETYPLPAVFINREITLDQNRSTEPIEVRAVPHVLISGQFFDSSGKPISGFAPHLSARNDTFGNRAWFWETTRIDEHGKFSVKSPKGFEASLDIIDNEHHAIKSRVSKDAPLGNGRTIKLGVLDHDMPEVSIIRYVAPILLVKAVGEDGEHVGKFSPSIFYQYNNSNEGGQYIRDGKSAGYVSFERQDDGRYRTSQLLPDEEFTLTVEAEGYEPKSEKFKLPEGEVKELEVKLKKKS